MTAAVVIPVTWILIATHQIAPPDGHWWALLILTVTGLLSVSLGSLLGVALKRSTTVALAAVILASYLFFLGGGFTTIAFLPNWLQEVESSGSHSLFNRRAAPDLSTRTSPTWPTTC